MQVILPARRVLLSAAAIVVIALLFLFMRGSAPEGTPIDPESRAKFLAAETEYVEIKQELMTVLEGRTGPDEEGVVADESLQIVQDAVLELRTALDDDPGNQALQNLLLKNYEREIRLLRKMCELPEGA